METFLPFILLAIIAISGIFTNIYKNASKENLVIYGDKNTIWVFRITYPLAIIMSFTISYSSIGKIQNSAYYFQLFGISFFIIGMIIRWWAILSLNKEFTVKISILKNHQLKTTGLYRYIRHPGYTGLILYYFGLGLTLQNGVSILLVFIVISLTILLRISVEEKVLLEHFGYNYRLYSESTKKLIPFIF